MFDGITEPVMVLCGRAASGKRKFATLLKALYPEIEHVEVGQLLRDAVDSRTSGIGEIIARHQLAGEHVPDNLVFEVLRKHIENLKAPIILDGFPRTIPQAKVFASLGPTWYGVRIERDEDFCRGLVQRRIAEYQAQGLEPRPDDTLETFERRSLKYPVEAASFDFAVELCGSPVYYTHPNVPELSPEVQAVINYHASFFKGLQRVNQQTG